MAQSVKKYFLFFITVLAGFFMSLQPLTVQAQVSDQPNVVDRVWVAKRGESPEYHTADLYNYLRNRIKDSSDNLSLSRSQFSSDLYRAMSSGTIMVVQGEYTSPRYGNYASYHVYFSYAKHDTCNFKVFYSQGSYILRSTTSPAVSNCGFHSAYYNVDAAVGVYNLSVLPPYIGVTFSSRNEFNKYSILFFNGEYELDSSAIGMNSLPRTDPGNPAFIPEVSWNDDCGTDIGCHLKNVATVFKAIFDTIIGIFDFSENNTILRFFKWLFIPGNIVELLDFSDLANQLRTALGPVFKSIDLLNRLYNILIPPVDYWNSSNHCSTSLAGDAGVQNSAAHRYIIQAQIFGYKFEPDICSFERAIGGYRAMSQVRLFSGFALTTISLFLWYRFIVRLIGERL